jgi:hypothetical protein
MDYLFNRLCFYYSLFRKYYKATLGKYDEGIGKIVEAKLTPQQLAEKYQEFMGS